MTDFAKGNPEIIFPTDDGALKAFLRNINKIPLLKPNDELRLAIRARKGEKAAQTQLVEANLRFVVLVAKQYQNQGLSLSDLIGEGCCGLIKAASRFDETRGFKFISYAVWWIRQAILQSLAEQSRIVRLPSNRAFSVSKVFRFKSDFERQYGFSPSLEVIAKNLELTEFEVIEAVNMRNRTAALDPLVDSDDGSTLKDILVDNSQPSPDELVINESISHAVRKVLGTIPPRESEILELLFGFSGRKYTLEEIGDRIGLTRERVRQLKEKALRRLQHSSRREFLMAAYNGETSGGLLLPPKPKQRSFLKDV
ncbi:RNA polymerase sigma factor RpoD/SigA [Candidatus Parcubacteria bacterium]|jgi:RNA polymerase primary sigma factor|nr:MAG: RNA polymerase sigma factor RpoD/SigA [Candidatus Parcubacteria bacterium]